MQSYEKKLRIICNFASMKASFCAIWAMIMAPMLFMSSLLQHHHHAADGSMCMCMSVECHALSAKGLVHEGCNHEHDDEGETVDCTLHIDEFCNKDGNRTENLMPDLNLLCTIVFDVELPKPSSQSLANHHIADAPKQKRCARLAIGLRAPPVNDYYTA